MKLLQQARRGAKGSPFPLCALHPLLTLTIILAIIGTATATDVTVTVDFSTTNKTMNFAYMSNENDAEGDFLNITSSQLVQYHKDIGTSHLRVVVKDLSLSNKCSGGWYNILPGNGTTYDYYCLDKLINQTLKIGASPWVVFAYDNQSGRRYYNSTGGENRSRFSGFIGNITARYFDVCTNGSWDTDWGNEPCGNMDGWYWQIIGEVHHGDWWPRNYTALFNETWANVRSAGYNPTVIGPDLTTMYWYSRFIAENPPYNLSTHHIYPPCDIDDYTLFMQNLSWYGYDSLANYSNYSIGMWGKQFIVGEYNVGGCYQPTPTVIQEQFGAAYYATMTRYFILGNVYGAAWFYGSGYSEPGEDPLYPTGNGYGMWHSVVPFNTYPSYSVAKLFAQQIKNGSTVVKGYTNDTLVDVLATKNGTQHNIVVINKRNATVSVNVSYAGILVQKWTNINDSTEITPPYGTGSNFYLTLNPYEVVFLKSTAYSTEAAIVNDVAESFGAFSLLGTAGLVGFIITILLWVWGLGKPGSSVDTTYLINVTIGVWVAVIVVGIIMVVLQGISAVIP